MKRKTMILSLVMVTALPYSLHAKGLGKVDVLSASSAGPSSSISRYGVAGVWTGHLSVPGVLSQSNAANEWQIQLLPPAAPYQSQSDDPLTANDKRVGVTFKLDF